MHLVKLGCLAIALFHALAPVRFLLPWTAGSLLVILLMVYLGRVRQGELVKRNIFILTFASFFSAFIAISSLVENRSVDPRYILTVSLRIIFIYNIIICSSKWLGKDGFLYFVNAIGSARIKLFLLLFMRAINSFRRIHSHVFFQIQSRIDMSSRERYLIPRYYVQNLISKELYAFRYNQAALVSRLPETGISPYYRKGRLSIKEVLSFFIILVTGFSDLLFQFSCL